MTHGPIEPEFIEQMQALARALDEMFNPNPGPKQIGFALLVTHFGELPGARTNYISNCIRSDMIAMLKEFIARQDGPQ